MKKEMPPHKCLQVTGLLDLTATRFSPPAAAAQERAQQLKSNEKRSDGNKREASDVASNDGEMVNAGSNKVNAGLVCFITTVAEKLFPQADAGCGSPPQPPPL